jgi:hypothetical protein
VLGIWLLIGGSIPLPLPLLIGEPGSDAMDMDVAAVKAALPLL